MRKLILLSLITLLSALYQRLEAQGYQIEIHLESNTDTIYYLANYYGDKFFIADTSNSQIGTAVFTGSTPLKQGIYLIANKKKEKLIEFLVGESQKFSIHAGKINADQNIEIHGSVDNQLFFDHIRFVNKAYAQIQENNAVMNQPESGNETKTLLQHKNDSINTAIVKFRNTIIRENPELLISLILSAMQDPEIPAAIKENQDASYRFYKSHFWSNIRLNDERLLRTPLLPMKLKTYFEQLVVPDADSIISEINVLIARTNKNQEVTDFLAWHFVSEYQTPKIMGLDKVFVYLVDNYFQKGKIQNVTESINEKLLERANKMRLSLLGMKAPEMWLIDTTGNYRSFHEIKNEYTVLIFWDQTCSHCKKEMESLYQLYNTGEFNLGVFAVNSTNDFEGWKHYLKEKKYPWLHVNGMKSMTQDFHDLYDIYSVPVVYLLDRNKVIIGKRISAGQIGNIIKNYQKADQ